MIEPTEEFEKYIDTKILEVKDGDILHVVLGASAEELNTDEPWIPTQADIHVMKEAFDNAMKEAGKKVTVIVTTIGVDIATVLKGEN